MFLGLLALPAPLTAQTSDDFFNNTFVHDLRLAIHSADWLKLKENFRTNEYYPADVRWTYQGQEIVVRNVGIRSRGSGSRSGTKPGLRVDIDHWPGSKDQEFLGLKSFVLDNLVQDASGIKETVTMRFFQRMGQPAPREAHARLYVNNAYIGLYALVESVDKRFLKRVFGTTDGNTENDGYLFEYRWTDGYGFHYLGSELTPYAELFSPKTHERDSAEKLYRPIEEMIRTINDAPDGDFERAVDEYLDLRNTIAHIALENFVAEPDGILGYAGMNNFYFYRFERTKRHRFIVWDKDYDFWTPHFPVKERVETNVLGSRIFTLPSLRHFYFTTLNDAAISAMAPLTDENGQVVDGRGWLEREVQREADLIRDSMRLDPSKPWSTEQFEDEVKRLVDFARERSGWVQTEVKGELGLSMSGPRR